MRSLVTGGGGFLGRRIVELLLEQGHEVRFLARGHYPEVEALGATGFRADLTDKTSLEEALEGCEQVFHAAARAGYWGPKEAFFSVNLDGTLHLMEAMRAAGCSRLVYTSTPSVVGYGHDVHGAAEVPYPSTWESHYGASKAAAERAVLAANGPELATVALRPHLIVGPRDPNLLPRVVQRARTGQLRIVGDGKNKVDITYIDNAAWAHLDAAQALLDHTAPCAGRAYFISNDEPVLLWEWVNDFLPAVGAPRVERSVPLGLASMVGAAFELAYRVLPLSGEPRMTRFVAAALARSHWYDMTPAKRDFGYTVRVPLVEGTAATVAWFNTLD